MNPRLLSPQVLRSRVSVLMQQPIPERDALIRVAEGGRTQFTHSEVTALLSELDAYPGTVDDYLAMRV